ncbi:MAG TPA: phosphodiester glycosidase family protein [Alphaproteobacteria bacterium]|nr:phosphodiester glycosidase family protein [Alphaproteobacteria bacterium]
MNRIFVSLKLALFGTCILYAVSADAQNSKNFAESKYSIFEINLKKSKMCFVKNLCGNPGLTINGPLYYENGNPVGGVYHSLTKKWDPAIVKPETSIMKEGILGNNNFNLFGLSGVFIIYRGDSCVIKSTEQFIEEDYGKEDKNGITRAFQNGPMLIQNGKIPTNIEKAKGARYSRVVIGYNKPGSELIVVYVYDDVTMSELAKYLQNQGIKNALYLDGAVTGFSYGGKCEGDIPSNAYKLNFINAKQK